jgi:hypothetical protein
MSAGSGPPDGDAVPFDELMKVVLAGAGRFGHREHVQLTWLAVRRYGTGAAIRLVADGIARTARYANVPQKYHETMSRAWVELVGYHATGDTSADFDAFAARFPELLNKRLLGEYYRSSTLASAQARAGWVEPDLRPLPG